MTVYVKINLIYCIFDKNIFGSEYWTYNIQQMMWENDFMKIKCFKNNVQYLNTQVSPNFHLISGE